MSKKTWRVKHLYGFYNLHTITAWNLLEGFINPFEVAKYKSSDLGELLDLLVQHQLKLNGLISNGNFRNKKYLRHRRSIALIQKAINSINEQQTKKSR